MFQQQQQQQPPPPQQQFAHRKPNIPSTAASQNEAQAKDKLAGYVYEYLMLSGATKAADAFKSEVLATTSIPLNILPGDPPGFLLSWWSVFWDLYASTPERRDKMESSMEAKAFHDFGFIPPSIFNPGNVNGVLPNPQFGNGGIPPMGIPQADLPNYFRNNPSQASAVNQSSPIAGTARGYGAANAAAGTRSGAPTPSNVMGGGGATNGPPPNFPPGAASAAVMYNEQQMRMAAQAQRMNANGPRMPNFNQAGIRQMRPGGFPGGFMDSPTGAPAGFAPNPAMMPNGMMSGLIASPGSQLNNGGPGGPMVGGIVPTPTTNPDGTPQHDPRFMMMGGNMTGQFSMGGHHDGAGTPTSCPSGGPPFGGPMAGMHSAGGPADGNPSNSGALQSLLNGGNSNASAGGGGGSEMELKHESPGSHLNNGTPGGGMAQMNPGSIQGGAPQQSAGPASVGNWTTNEQYRDMTAAQVAHEMNIHQSGYGDFIMSNASLLMSQLSLYPHAMNVAVSEPSWNFTNLNFANSMFGNMSGESAGNRMNQMNAQNQNNEAIFRALSNLVAENAVNENAMSLMNQTNSQNQSGAPSNLNAMDVSEANSSGLTKDANSQQYNFDDRYNP